MVKNILFLLIGIIAPCICFGQNETNNYKAFHHKYGEQFFLIESNSTLVVYEKSDVTSPYKNLSDELTLLHFGNFKYYSSIINYVEEDGLIVNLHKYAIPINKNDELLKMGWVELVHDIDGYKYLKLETNEIITWENILDNYLSFQNFNIRMNNINSSIDTCANTYYNFYVDSKVAVTVRQFPTDTSKIIYPNKNTDVICDNYMVVEVSGDWLKIKIIPQICSEIVLDMRFKSCKEYLEYIEKYHFKNGWIKWRNETDLFVNFYIYPH